HNVESFVVPQELQSFLSLVYSNIPPIKKGTDSRVGFGFRLGDHADFQVMLELGPQKETRPLGEASKDDPSFNKRQVSATDLQEQIRKQQFLSTTERNAASWLETWSSGMQPQAGKVKSKPRIKQIAKVAAPTKPQMDAMQQLKMLYKMANNASATSTTTTTTAAPLVRGALKLGGPSGFTLPPPALTQDTNALGNIKPIKNSAKISEELMNVSLEA
ncbi:CG2837, partial [Drosophila busckii]